MNALAKHLTCAGAPPCRRPPQHTPHTHCPRLRHSAAHPNSADPEQRAHRAMHPTPSCANAGTRPWGHWGQRPALSGKASGKGGTVASPHAARVAALEGSAWRERSVHRSDCVDGDTPAWSLRRGGVVVHARRQPTRRTKPGRRHQPWAPCQPWATAPALGAYLAPAGILVESIGLVVTAGSARSFFL